MNRVYRQNITYVFLTLIILAFLTSCVASKITTQAPAQTQWNQEDLQQTIDDWRVRSNVPGVVVGLSLPDHSEMILTSGESDIEKHIAIEADDQFQVASISKTFIAAEILMLASEGKLNLDDPLNDYLTEVPYGNIVTIRHLLSHRSGYFDPIHDDPGFIPFLAEDLEKEWTWDEMLEITFQHELFFQPGSGYRYSNANYLLLALVIERFTQKTLDEILTSHFLSPLQLEHTQVRTVETDIHRTDLVHGYATHPVTGDIVDIMSIPNTAILSVSTDTVISNASDLLKWSRVLYGKESVILAPDLQEQMLTFDDISPYGLGVFQFHTPLGVSYGHGGDTAGYLSLMEYFPKQGISLVILVNADAPSSNLSGLRDLLIADLFKTDQGSAIKDLIANLKSENSATRKTAIIALGHDGSRSEEVIQALITALKEDSNAENRKEAALALGLVGENSEQAKQALNEALQDQDDSVRGAAAIALSIIE
jgi:D-alanyl-D-alanine carboxypeptidase